VKLSLILRLAGLCTLVLLLAACGSDNEDTPQTPVTQGAVGTAEVPQESPTPEGPAPTPTPDPAAPLTPEQLQELKPNELGWIPVLQYHYFGPVPDELTRTPEQFRADLQWLYDNDFYVVNVRDYIHDTMDVPAGKRPVMLTFDDSSVNQFSLKVAENGQLIVEGDSAVAIMETFFQEHPDFGRGGHFAILPDRAFSWPDAWDQQEYVKQKLEWLIANGYELGNHTLDHENLALVETPDIQYQLAEAELLTQTFIPDIRLEIVTLPYGGYPHGGDDTVFRGFDYKGTHWVYDAVFLVGANPAYSVLSTQYDPYAIPRIQVFDEEINRWKTFIEENPGIMYVSDGNPDTVTVPHDLPYELVDTLDESKLNGRELVRY